MFKTQSLPTKTSNFKTASPQRIYIPSISQKIIEDDSYSQPSAIKPVSQKIIEDDSYNQPSAIKPVPQKIIENDRYSQASTVKNTSKAISIRDFAKQQHLNQNTNNSDVKQYGPKYANQNKKDSKQYGPKYASQNKKDSKQYEPKYADQNIKDSKQYGSQNINDLKQYGLKHKNIEESNQDEGQESYQGKQYQYNYIKTSTNNNYKVQSILGIAIMFITIAIIYIQLDRETIPTSMAMAKLETTTIATQAINEAIAQTLATNQTNIEDLLAYDYNDDGDQVSWNVNSILINNLCAQIIARCSDALQNIGILPFEIPLGNLTGSRIFANFGPDITIEVLPIGTVTVDYDNDLKETGINQINHTVWLDVEATIQIVVPLFEEEVVVNRRIMLIDKVSSGEVPPSYVNVPSDSILDAPLESPGFDY
ncbi:MAG: sporulation protein YunB [Candidatus Epulonipiscioides saccharophilum]|nr:MAG: sporulation protein YunB [Epulopiscium sp. AS2M-Bin001]